MSEYEKSTSRLGLTKIVCLLVASVVFLGCNQDQTKPDAEPTNVSIEAEGKEAVEKLAGCCGKCQAETAEMADSMGCANGCTACAEGKSESCHCEETTGTAESEAKSGNTVAHDRDVFHFLLTNHEKIKRSVTEIDNGVETLTESDDPAVVAKIQEHVASMYERVENGRPLRRWDTLYQEVFKHADKIEMKLENTENGIKVIETSEDEYVVKLIRTHAKVVSGFAEKGFEEAQKNHEPPSK